MSNRITMMRALVHELTKVADGLEKLTLSVGKSAELAEAMKLSASYAVGTIYAIRARAEDNALSISDAIEELRGQLLSMEEEEVRARKDRKATNEDRTRASAEAHETDQRKRATEALPDVASVMRLRAVKARAIEVLEHWNKYTTRLRELTSSIEECGGNVDAAAASSGLEWDDPANGLRAAALRDFEEEINKLLTRAEQKLMVGP